MEQRQLGPGNIFRILCWQSNPQLWHRVECLNDHPSLSTLRSRGLSRSKSDYPILGADDIYRLYGVRANLYRTNGNGLQTKCKQNWWCNTLRRSSPPARLQDMSLKSDWQWSSSPGVHYLFYSKNFPQQSYFVSASETIYQHKSILIASENFIHKFNLDVS